MPSAVDPNTVVAWATLGLAVFAAVSLVQSFLYLRELRAGHFRSIRPLLLWQDPHSWQVADANMHIRAEFSFVIRSAGSGAARVTSAKARTNLGDVLPIRDLRVPATMPVDAQYTFELTVPDLVTSHLRGVTHVRIDIIYGDLESYASYATYAELSAEKLSPEVWSFRDVDERPPNERRVKKSNKGHARAD